MRVLFYTSIFQFQGGNGGRTVFLKTMESLRRRGIEVDLFDQWRCDFKRYDLVHCFTMETTSMWDYVKAVEGRLAVTPISWYGVYTTLRSRIIRAVKRRVRAKIKCPLHQWWEDYFRYPDVFFPQSDVQAQQLAVAFGVPPQKTIVVYHGVDERFADASPAAFVQAFKREGFVLCVARFEPRKNQLGLIRALRGTGVPLVFIGQPDNERFEPYYRQCVGEADPSTLFIKDLPHDSDLMRSAYAAARVFVLPSHVEFPGLAALEAGLAGCRVAMTRGGCSREYLGDHAAYFDPYSEAEIRTVTLQAFQESGPRDGALRDHIARNFLWDTVTRRNVEGYEMILDSARSR